MGRTGRSTVNSVTHPYDFEVKNSSGRADLLKEARREAYAFAADDSYTPRAVPASTPMFVHAVIDADRRAPDPVALLLRAYDRAIRACETFDSAGAHQAISVLRDALDLESAASRSFDSLYKWSEECVESRDFVSAAQCLRTLRDAWRRATQDPAGSSTGWSDLPVC
jgi:hypothetical protein